MRRLVLVGAAVAFVAMLAAIVWLWRDRAAVIRERDTVVSRFVDGCNMIHTAYGSAERSGARLKDSRPDIAADAKQVAERLAWQHLGFHYWLTQCATDGDRASELDGQLSEALRHHRADDIPRLVSELRQLVPLRAEGTRSWLRERTTP